MAGRRVSWMWGGKRYYGTLIPSRETKDARFARTENGKIKRLPKKKKQWNLQKLKITNINLLMELYLQKNKWNHIKKDLKNNG